MISKTSLYDQYRLQNSNAIPLYEGSTAPEAIKVGEYMQGLYDQASQGAGDISSASDNIQSLPQALNMMAFAGYTGLKQDKSLADELKNHIQGKINEWSSARDWENHVSDVRSLGREYANRATELAKPIQQYQEWKKTLDEKDRNLTPEHKQALNMMALAGYTGLKKDPMGRYVGQFSGIEPAKNIDYNEKVDKWMKDIAIQKGGSEIANFNGAWKIKRGNKWENLDSGTIQRTLEYAMTNDSEFNSSIAQDANISAFHGMRAIKSIDQLTPAAKAAVAQRMAKGYDLKSSVADVLRETAANSIKNLALHYAVSKYTYHKRESTSDMDYNSALGNLENANANGMFGDAVVDVGKDLTEQYGSADKVEETYKATSDELERTKNELGATKQMIARSIGVPVDKLTDKQVTDYYVAKDPAGLGAYKAKAQLVIGNQSKLAELDQLRTRAMDLASRKKTGKSFDELKSSATAQLPQFIDKFKMDDGKNRGKSIPVTNEVKEGVKSGQYEVIDGSEGSGAFGNTGYVEIKNKSTGKIIKLYSSDDPGARKIGKQFSGINWKSSWEEAGRNIRSNTMWMPLNNKTTPDGQVTKSGAYSSRVENILRAGSGALSVKDMNLQDLSGDDVKDTRARISAGKFDALGIGKVASDGKLYVKLSVDTDAEEKDPAKRYKTVVVGVESNMANKLSQCAIQAGLRDKDIRAYQFGLAMAPGSGYEQVLNIGTMGGLQIDDNSVTGKGKPLQEIVPNITGNSSDALSYEVYDLDENGKRIGKSKVPGTDQDLTFNDAYDLGAYIDRHRSNGRAVKRKTK